MLTRTLSFVLLLLAVPSMAQQPTMAGGRLNAGMWSDREIRPEPPRQSELDAARIRAIHRDAEELSALQATLQTQLQLLERGMLHKDLAENLKKTEKLAKKLRQEVIPR